MYHEDVSLPLTRSMIHNAIETGGDFSLTFGLDLGASTIFAR